MNSINPKVPHAKSAVGDEFFTSKYSTSLTGTKI
jgi:hypothetical protein